jgi:dodecin
MKGGEPVSEGRCHHQPFKTRRQKMPGSTYKIIEVVGTSDKSWEDAASTAIKTAGKSLKDLRITEVTKLDVTVEDGIIKTYRARLSLSFKYQQ